MLDIWWPDVKGKGKGKGSCLESRLYDNACSTDFTFPLARWAPIQPGTIDPTLDLCIWYPFWLGGWRQCGIQNLPDTSADGQHWESNPRPSDLRVQCPIHWATCGTLWRGTYCNGHPYNYVTCIWICQRVKIDYFKKSALNQWLYRHQLTLKC